MKMGEELDPKIKYKDALEAIGNRDSRLAEICGVTRGAVWKHRKDGMEYLPGCMAWRFVEYQRRLAKKAAEEFGI